MSQSSLRQHATKDATPRKDWQEPRIVLERSLEVTAQGEGPFGPFGPLST
jgi:hypothetical protein